MTTIQRLIEKLSPRAEVVFAEGNFADTKKALESEGYRISSAEEIAGARIAQGRGADICRRAGWIREGFIYVPRRGVFLTKNSPIIENPEEAVDCHRNERDFYLSETQLEQALEGAIQINESSIPIDRFGKEEVTSYLFGENAARYGKFLKKTGIEAMPLYLLRAKEKPFVTQIVLGAVGRITDQESMILGYSGSLDSNHGRTFGVRDITQDRGI